MAIILNGIGIIFIIYAIYFIKKENKNIPKIEEIKETSKVVEDLILIEERVKEYYNLTEDIVEEFDKIIDNKLESIKIEQENNIDSINDIDIIPSKNIFYQKDAAEQYNKQNAIIDINKEKEENQLKVTTYPKKILELKKLGLTDQEIAKSLNKGVREIEIVLKMYS